MVYTIVLGKQGKRIYTIGPERRVYTIEPQTLKKKKRRVSTVVVYTFFFPDSFCTLKMERIENIFGEHFLGSLMPAGP